MKEQPCTLLAFDADGGQAIFRQGEKWYRIAADDGWTPTELQSRRSVVRCMLLAPYAARDETHDSVNALVAAIETAWDASSDLEDVPLDEVVHLFPEPVRRAWHTQQEERRREQERLNEQSERLQRAIVVERRPPQAPRWWPSPAWRPSPPLPPGSKLEWPSRAHVFRRARVMAANFDSLQHADIEDLASEAFLAVARVIIAAPEKRRPASEYVWSGMVADIVDKTVRKMSVASAVRRGRLPVKEPPLEEIVDTKALPDEAVCQNDVLYAIEATVASLKPRDAELAKLFLDFYWTWPRPAAFSARRAVREWRRVKALLAEGLRQSGFGPTPRQTAMRSV